MQTSPIIYNLFKAFHDNNINYCHWKSNEHLDASFRGETDFDILFDISQKDLIKKIFIKNGYALFVPPYNRSYTQIEDYIALDFEQNKIIHIHTHYQMVIGTSGLKEYRYSIENSLLDNRIFLKEFECYSIAPAYEFVLLLLRLSLKIQKNWKYKFNQNKEILNSGIELNWLKERVNFDMLWNLIQELKLPYQQEDIAYIYQNGLDYNKLISLSLLSHKVPKLKKDNYLTLTRKKTFKWIYFQYGRVLRKLSISYVTKQRVKYKDGFSIAILGSDGSGKSTQLVELKKILSKKIDVASFYLGSNKGSKSRLRKVLEYIRNKKLTFNIQILQNLLTIALAFSIAIEKKTRLNRAQTLKQKGVLIIFDRFPQNQFYGHNDGPILKKMATSKNRFFSRIGKIEKKMYLPPVQQFPNIIFKLIANPEVLSLRRNMTIEEITRKQNGILKLEFGNKSTIVEVDATKSIEAVTSAILKEIQITWLNPNYKNKTTK